MNLRQIGHFTSQICRKREGNVQKLKMHVLLLIKYAKFVTFRCRRVVELPIDTMHKTEMSLASNMRLSLCSSSQIESCSALSVLLSTTICVTTVAKERQCGPVVRALASRSGDHGFKTRSDHSLNLILVVPSALVDSQLL